LDEFAFLFYTQKHNKVKKTKWVYDSHDRKKQWTLKLLAGRLSGINKDISIHPLMSGDRPATFS